MPEPNSRPRRNYDILPDDWPLPPHPKELLSDRKLATPIRKVEEGLLEWLPLVGPLLDSLVYGPRDFSNDPRRVDAIAYLENAVRGRSSRFVKTPLEQAINRFGTFVKFEIEDIEDGEPSTIRRLVFRGVDFEPVPLGDFLDRWWVDLWRALGYVVWSGSDDYSRDPDPGTITRGAYDGPAREPMRVHSRAVFADPAANEADDPLSEEDESGEPDEDAVDGDVGGPIEDDDESSDDTENEAEPEQEVSPAFGPSETESLVVGWLRHLGDCVLRGAKSDLLGRRPYGVIQQTLQRTENAPTRTLQTFRVFIVTRAVAVEWANARIVVVPSPQERENLREVGVLPWARARTLTLALVSIAEHTLRVFEPGSTDVLIHQEGRRAVGHLLYLLQQASQASEMPELAAAFGGLLDAHMREAGNDETSGGPDADE